MSGIPFPTLLSILPLLPESVRTVVRAHADVITKFSDIDRFLFSIPSHDSYRAPLLQMERERFREQPVVVVAGVKER